MEDLQAGYDGSGTYEATEDTLTRQFDVGEGVAAKVEYYMRKDSNLILSEETGSAPAGLFPDYYPMIYTLKQSPNK